VYNSILPAAQTIAAIIAQNLPLLKKIPVKYSTSYFSRKIFLIQLNLIFSTYNSKFMEFLHSANRVEECQHQIAEIHTRPVNNK
jgi:hypothetical protein